MHLAEWISAADAARITDVKAGIEDQKHKSGGVFVAVDSNLGAVVGGKEGAVNVRGDVRILAAYFWHTEGFTPRNEALLEAVLKRAGVTEHPWLVACDRRTGCMW